MNKTHINLGLLLIRLTLAVLMLFHGYFKLVHGVGSIEKMLAAKGLPEILAYLVFIGELIAPVLLAIGYRTRMAALLLAINMVFTIYLAHSSEIFQRNEFGAWMLEVNGLYLFIALALVLTGGGKIAVSTNKAWD